MEVTIQPENIGMPIKEAYGFLNKTVAINKLNTSIIPFLLQYIQAINNIERLKPSKLFNMLLKKSWVKFFQLFERVLTRL